MTENGGGNPPENFTDFEIERAVLENPWRNAYWFARMLISSDKYGSVGKDNKFLSDLATRLRSLLGNSRSQPIGAYHALIDQMTTTRYRRAIRKQDQVRLFVDDVNKRLRSDTDVRVFLLTIESLMIPLNSAMAVIPSNDREFTLVTARAYMDRLGPFGLSRLINMWDDLGVEGSLNAERRQVVQQFLTMKQALTSGGVTLTDTEQALFVTAFIQEFERRLGQKRKSRAGGSLEDVTSFLFDYYHIASHPAPDHFQADIEVDKWFRTRDGWLIGISCKRTLRERWKQVSSGTSDLLSKYKIKEIWHVITFDQDLSDDKITLLGGQRHVFYLSDDSRVYQRAKAHIGLQDYVRPITQLIDDIYAAQH